MNAKLTELMERWFKDEVIPQLRTESVFVVGHSLADLQRRIEAELCVMQHRYLPECDDFISTRFADRPFNCVNCGREKE